MSSRQGHPTPCFAVCLLAGLAMLTNLSAASAADSLSREQFENPPLEARPTAWWDWLNGNADPKTITTDLEEAKAEEAMFCERLLAAGSARELARQLKARRETKNGLGPDELLFPVSARAGVIERKTHKMMQRDLEAARTAWINEAKSD